MATDDLARFKKAKLTPQVAQQIFTELSLFEQTYLPTLIRLVEEWQASSDKIKKLRLETVAKDVALLELFNRDYYSDPSFEKLLKPGEIERLKDFATVLIAIKEFDPREPIGPELKKEIRSVCRNWNEFRSNFEKVLLNRSAEARYELEPRHPHGPEAAIF